MIRTARTARAVGALTILLALIVGVPALLAGTIGNPADAWAYLKVGDITDQVVIDVLAAVAWVAWAQFAAGVLAETIAAMRRAPAPHLPMVPAPSRQLARVLVTAVLIAGTASVALAPSAPSVHATGGIAGPRFPPSATVAAFSTTHAETLAVTPDMALAPSQTDTRPTSSGAPADTTPDATPTYVVPAGGTGPDTYWDIAAAYYGGGQHWTAIWDLNRGRTQPDGTVMTEPGLLRPGWTVLLPADSTTTADEQHDARGGAESVRVHPGDTLSGIAAAHGQPDWHRAWAASADMPEPGGETFTDPDLILPGWRVDVPVPPATTAPAAAPAASRTNHAPVPAAPTTTPPGEEPAPLRALAPSAAAAIGAPDRHDAAPAPGVTPPTIATADPQNPRASSVAGGQTPPRNEVHDSPSPAEGPSSSASHGSSGLKTIGFGAGGALLAGAALGTLALYRRRQFRWRRPGRFIALPTPDLQQIERDLLAAGTVAAADVTWLDTALRGLARTTAASDRTMPDVLAVRMTDDVLDLILTGPDPDPPDPWTTHPYGDEPGRRWSLRRADTSALTEADRQRQLAPFPTLATIGHTPAGENWLLDLERVGALSLTGDRDRCLDLARFIAAELAHNTWSQMLTITLAGFGAEMADVNPDRLTHTADLPAALTALRRQVDSVTVARQDLHVDVLGGRQRDIAGDAWAAHVLLVAPEPAVDPPDPATQAETDDLLAAMRAQPGRTAAALLIADDTAHTDQTRWQLKLDADGTLTLPALGFRLIAQQLPAAEAAALTRLLAQAADTTDRPMPPAHGHQPWDTYADAAGNLRADAITSTAEPVVLHLVDPTDPPPWRAASVLPSTTQTYLDRTQAAAEDLDALAPPVSDARAQQVRDADQRLDRDLADWNDPHCPRPKVSVLGPVRVRARGTLPERSPRPAWNTEVVIYLATHPGGVSSDQFGADLWPDPVDSGSTSKVRQAAVTVRHWLGADPHTGRDYLPKSHSGGAQQTAGRYQLEDVLLDSQLFRRLRLRGQSRGPDGTDDLWTALRLVTGVPYDQIRAGGYTWLADHHDNHTFAAMIYDTAHTVALHHIGAGEPLRAAEAARVALLAGSSEDTPLLDLMFACDAHGDWSQGDAYQRRVLANHDADIPEDCPPSTAQALIRRERLRRTAT